MNKSMRNISVLTLCGVAAAGAAIAIAGPLDPPAGPVSETQPSLASISGQLSQLTAGGGLGFPPNLQYHREHVGGNQQSETVEFVSASEAEFVRIYAVFVNSSVTNLLVGSSEENVAQFGGSAVLSTGQLVGGNQYNFGGLRVPTPVKFHTGGQDSASLITLLYWVED